MLSNADIYRWLFSDGSRGGNRPRDDGFGHAPRMAPRPRRTVHRMTITGLPYETSWQVSKTLPPLSWP